MINSFKLLLFNKSFCVELCIFWNMAGLYFCESSFIQNDSMFAENGTFFLFTVKNVSFATVIE